MTTPVADFPDFEARVDAAIEALARSERTAGASFAASSTSAELVTLTELVAMVRASDDPDAALDFSAEARDGGPLAELRRDFAAFIRGVWRDLRHLAVVDTGGEGQVQVHTRIGWTGDTISVIAGDVGVAQLDAHGAAVRAAVLATTRRIRLLTTMATTATKIAAMIASPSGAVMALPLAYKLVREMYEQWRTTGPEPGPGG